MMGAYNNVMKRNIFETYFTLTLILTITSVMLIALLKYPITASSGDSERSIEKLRFERISLYLDKTR